MMRIPAILVIWRIRLWALVVLCFGLSCALPAFATTIFGLVDTQELFSSTDAGVTWSVHATLDASDAVALAAGATSAELYIGTRSGTIYRSGDGGSGWSIVGTVAASDVTDLAVLTSESVFLLTESGVVYFSSDHGATFTALAALSGSNYVSLSASGPETLYTLTETGEVASSGDGGGTWSTVGTMPVSDARNIRMLGASLYVLTGTGGIFRSDDSGSTWTPISTLSRMHMSGLATDGTQLFASVREGAVAASTDGVAWTWQGTMNQLSVVALGTDVPAVSGIDGPTRPYAFSLGQNYPNPFNPDTQITYIPFELREGGHVELSVYDAAGRVVGTLISADLAPDLYRIPWRGRDCESNALPPGVYFYQLRLGSSVSSRKVLAVR
jgi:photosystem II stability/assembly factor-like uncharacterized protein